MADVMVRMGELAASAGDDVLVTLGLGSCIGLALMDRRMGLAGLAHIVLPTSTAGAGTSLGKFAHTAVPALIAELVALGARRPRLEAILVGGAMLGARSKLDVGSRNESATREHLARARIPVVAAQTGGSQGRTIRVHVSDGAVTVKAAGGPLVPLWPRVRMREAVAG